LLEQYNLTAYKIGNELGGHTKMPTVYRLADKDNPPSRADFETIVKVLDALRSLTGEDIQLTDLIEYSPDE
jgi:hypothetical protein